MTTQFAEQTLPMLEVALDIEIVAPIDIVFQSLLEQMGPSNRTPDGQPLPMVLEPWPGGRWFRDFGNNTGHFWGHVQSFRPATLLEIHGPLFMSAPAVSHVLYRLSEENGITQVKFSHRAIGQISRMYFGEAEEHNVRTGWSNLLDRVRNQAASQ